jgi:undecaprenyl phosphate N,N'-diacetylbacillosamine 1-phosphate transferase
MIEVEKAPEPIQLALKRAIDLVGAIVLIVLFSPLLVAIVIAIRLDSKGSPIFRQRRLGLRMQEFDILKFRTMVKDAETIGTGVFTNANDSRITKVGSWLRRYSLDELPQLFNVLFGQMSFIGPRPPVVYHPYVAENYPAMYVRRFDMKPGITGLAQVNGRANLTWPQRFVLDMQYIDNYTVMSDMAIILSTLIKVLSKEDVFPSEDFIEKNHTKT